MLFFSIILQLLQIRYSEALHKRFFPLYKTKSSETRDKLKKMGYKSIMRTGESVSEGKCIKLHIFEKLQLEGKSNKRRKGEIKGF